MKEDKAKSSRTNRHKLLNFIPISHQPRRWAHIKRCYESYDIGNFYPQTVAMDRKARTPQRAWEVSASFSFIQKERGTAQVDALWIAGLSVLFAP